MDGLGSPTDEGIASVYLGLSKELMQKYISLKSHGMESWIGMGLKQNWKIGQRTKAGWWIMPEFG